MKNTDLHTLAVQTMYTMNEATIQQAKMKELWDNKEDEAWENA